MCLENPESFIAYAITNLEKSSPQFSLKMVRRPSLMVTMVTGVEKNFNQQIFITFCQMHVLKIKWD